MDRHTRRGLELRSQVMVGTNWENYQSRSHPRCVYQSKTYPLRRLGQDSCSALEIGALYRGLLDRGYPSRGWHTLRDWQWKLQARSTWPFQPEIHVCPVWLRRILNTHGSPCAQAISSRIWLALWTESVPRFHQGLKLAFSCQSCSVASDQATKHYCPRSILVYYHQSTTSHYKHTKAHQKVHK